MLSDLIGFQYMHAPAAESAADLIRRIKELPDGSHILIALDGENPWDYYPNSGRDFLRRAYQGIRNDSALEAVTLSEALKRRQPEKLNWLAPGSWANASFSIWIGHPEDHQAWNWIARARAALMERRSNVPDSDWELAYEELLVAEGSDWMWWFGNDFSSDSDAIFDSLFRQHIGNVFQLIGLPEPASVTLPPTSTPRGSANSMSCLTAPLGQFSLFNRPRYGSPSGAYPTIPTGSAPSYWYGGQSGPGR